MSVKKLQNFIGGKYQSPLSDSVSDVIDQSTEQVYAHAPVSSAADVDQAYKVAAKAFETWSQTTPSERQLALFRIADALEARAEEAADVESENTGKPRTTLVDSAEDADLIALVSVRGNTEKEIPPTNYSNVVLLDYAGMCSNII